MFRKTLVIVGFLVNILLSPQGGLAAELLIGTASADITPAEPVAVSGQFHLRIAKTVETPITANVIALESCEEGLARDVAIMVSCDLLYIPSEVLELIRNAIQERLPGLDTMKLFLNGTHTHTAPVLLLDKYPIPNEGVIQVEQYRAFLAQRVADAIVRAWNSRSAGSVTWGLSHAVVAYNRRAVYADGSARMYGKTDIAEFRNLEGYEDHDVNTLFFWNDSGELVGIVVNVSCPSQEVESRSAVNADFWHPVREALRERFGGQLCILGWTGASGDQSPHLMYRKAADERMRKLRRLNRLEEIARRIVRAVEDAYETVKNDRHADVPLIHKVETIQLPMRLVTEAEYIEGKVEVEKAAARIEQNSEAAVREYRRMKWYEMTVNRFNRQRTDPKPAYEMELHVLRIGDVAICTNSFELFTDYGIQMKARSKAVQTFVVQLVGPGTYLPTEKAIRGGHYSAVVHSSLVGPEGGNVLVDRTVNNINSLWTESRPKAKSEVVTKGLILDLDADRGIKVVNERVASWRNQVDSKAKTFVATRDASHKMGTGHPVLKEKVPAIGGHNTVVFRRQELINSDEDAFDHLITGSGYTWFAVMSVYSQVSGLKDVNSFFGNLRNGGKYEGFWAGLKDDNTLWMGSRNGITFGRWDKNNPQLVGPKLKKNRYYVIAGRMGAGTGKVTIELFVNGTKPVAYIPFPVNPKANSSKMAIGQERDATNHPGHESFDGELARFLMWDRPLSNLEFQKILSMLKNTYGLTNLM